MFREEIDPREAFSLDEAEAYFGRAEFLDDDYRWYLESIDVSGN